MTRRRGLVWVWGGLTLAILAGAACAQATAPAPVNLLAGGAWEYSTDDGQTWDSHPPVVPFGEAELILARTSFNVRDAAGILALELSHNLPPRYIMVFGLNGRRIPVPLKGMYYRNIPAIPAAMLKRGSNTLTAKIAYENRIWDKYRRNDDETVELPAELLALKAEHLKLESGPILGAAGNDHFTVTMRTNLPADAELYYGPAGASGDYAQRVAGDSVKGLYHRFRAEGLKGGNEYGFYCVARAAGGAVKVRSQRGRVRAYPEGNRLRFASVGDSQSVREDWQTVAEAVAAEKPALVVSTGDRTDSGREDWRWNEHFLGPGGKLLSSVPFYAVLGNHEENAPADGLLFARPAGDGSPRNWAQEISGVLLIGIDGRQRWTTETANHKWLEGKLAPSKARFIFLFTHYPAWTSGIYGVVDEFSGRAWCYEVRQGREDIVPLLQKYGATAMINGHEHLYERSELPAKDANGRTAGELTLITSGLAGATARLPKPDERSVNPYSKVLSDAMHYCLFEVNGDTCIMRALKPDGGEIDTRTWKARKP